MRIGVSGKCYEEKHRRYVCIHRRVDVYFKEFVKAASSLFLDISF